MQSNVTIPTTRADAVTLRTYSRLTDEGNQDSTLETWDEINYRAAYSHHKELLKGIGVDPTPYEAELLELERLGRFRLSTVAGRTLFLGGTKYAYSRPCCQFNCAGTTISSVYDVVDLAWLLLNGCGVGFKPQVGTLHGFTNTIDNVQVIDSILGKDDRGRIENLETLPSKDNDYTWTIQIGDSAEAWAKTVGKLFSSGNRRAKTLVIDGSQIRGAGGRLKGYGWICNGFEPFKVCLLGIVDTLNRKSGQLLDEIDILDCCNRIGEVLSSRRSAQLCILDSNNPVIKQFEKAKFEYWNGRNHRRQSNNSSLFWSKPSKERLRELLHDMDACGGDPGIINAEAARLKAPWFERFNPCVEILLGSFCVEGSTIIITKDGGATISSLVDKEVEVWNGEQWSKVTPKITGADQKLLRVTLNDGSYLDCTPYHRFSVKLKDQLKYREVQAKDLLTTQSRYYLEPFSIEADTHTIEEVSFEAAYTMGVLVGDGSTVGSHLNLDLYGAKIHLPVLGIKSESIVKPGYKVKSVTVTRLNKSINEACPTINAKKFLKEIRENCDNLLRILSWSKEAMLAFIAGVADTDGSETGTGGIRIYSSKLRSLQILQLALRKCGITCSLCLMLNKGSINNFGVRKSSIYYLQITDCYNIPCQRLDTSKGHKLISGKGSKQYVVKVEEIPGTHTVYCFNEPLRHKAVFGNMLTYQCNLVNNCLPRYGQNFASLSRSIEIMARANYRQTCVDLRDGILQPKWHQANEALRLCGVSLTGIVQADYLTDYQIRQLKASAVYGAYSMADELGLPRPKAVTTVTPGGTISKVMGGTDIGEIAEGVHKPLGRFIFNWINYSVNDPIVQIARESGYKVIPNPQDKNNVLVCFPVEYKNIKFDIVNGTEVNLEPATVQLDRYLRWNTLWADHNVSCTISYSPDELDDVADWLDTNWDKGYIATAFLRRTDPTKTAKDLGHPYLPQEVMTEAVFREYEGSLKPLALNRLHGIYDTDEAGCANGQCAAR